MKLIPRQKIWLTIVIVANLALWVIPSDVAELVAKDRQTLLGRYSREHFAWIMFAAVFSVVSLYVDWSTGETYKKRWFQVIAVLIVIMPSIVLIDFLLRTPERLHYIREGVSYHRPPNGTFEYQFEDKPEAYRTYPNVRPGYGTLRGTCTTDNRGFRNAGTLEKADIVVLGDSFAEGSNVPDGVVWPVLLAEKLGADSVNLGMSGYGPGDYVESLRNYGLSLKPRIVLCMLYEGNDFRAAGTALADEKTTLSRRLKKYFKQSPLKDGLDKLVIRTLGPVNSTGSIRGAEIVDWLPVAVPEGPKAKYYAFTPDKVRDLYEDADEFAGGRHWRNLKHRLEEMAALCRQDGCRFVVTYAPTTAHVVLPLAVDKLAAANLRAFTAISYRGDLPDADTFLAKLLSSIDARENVVASWCQEAAIPFVGLTHSLRRAVADGVQAYYSYDQHWTPDGHAIVAEHLAASLKAQ